MKARAMEETVEATAKRLPDAKIEELLAEVRAKKPPDLVEPRRMSMRRARLEEAEIRPSALAQERILGTNDLVDVI